MICTGQPVESIAAPKAATEESGTSERKNLPFLNVPRGTLLLFRSESFDGLAAPQRSLPGTFFQETP
jgi:hypothetical protein